MLSRNDRALLSYYLRPEWPRVAAVAVLLFAGIGFRLANPQITRVFIDRAQAGEPLDRLVGIALLFIAVALFTQGATVAETFFAEDLGWRTTNALRSDVTRHVLDLDASFHADHTPGELIERVDGDVSAVADFFARFVVQVLGNALFLLGVLVLLWLVDWRVGLLLTGFAIARVRVMTTRGGFVGERSRSARVASARLTGYLEERLVALPDIKTSGADAYVMRGFLERAAARFHAQRGAMLGSAWFGVWIGLPFVLGTGVALALSAWLHLGGAITLGSVYLVFRYTSMLWDPLDRLARQMNSFQRATGGIVRIRELVATPRSVIDGAGATFPAGALAVELEGVWFAYGTEPVLRDVSFRLDPGTVLALVGRTGSGKTTLSRLLFRLQDPTAGAVRLGGVDLREARLDELRARVGLVTQDVQLFEGTLRDNVTLFDEAVTDARLVEIFSALGLADWLRSQPAGLDTVLGAAGRGLSAGEAQLVALARVFLKDPGLVVLDEASSRLDPATERLLQDAVDRLLAGRTAVVIAHRLATVERADEVLVLEEGRVAELGRRDELAGDHRSRFAGLLQAGRTS